MIVRIAKKGQFDVADLAIFHRLLMVCVSSSAALPKKVVFCGVCKKRTDTEERPALLSALYSLFTTQNTLLFTYVKRKGQKIHYYLQSRPAVSPFFQSCSQPIQALKKKSHTTSFSHHSRRCTQQGGVEEERERERSEMMSCTAWSLPPNETTLSRSVL